MTTEYVQSLIDGLKQLNAKGFSQAQLARMLGVNRQSLWDWFHGRSTPTLEAGLRIQKLLKGRKSPKN
jgi:transcriptional regulator with XRE-family HTH domain